MPSKRFCLLEMHDEALYLLLPYLCDILGESLLLEEVIQYGQCSRVDTNGIRALALNLSLQLIGFS